MVEVEEKEEEEHYLQVPVLCSSAEFLHAMSGTGGLHVRSSVVVGSG